MTHTLLSEQNIELHDYLMERCRQYDAMIKNLPVETPMTGERMKFLKRKVRGHYESVKLIARRKSWEPEKYEAKVAYSRKKSRMYTVSVKNNLKIIKKTYPYHRNLSGEKRILISIAKLLKPNLVLIVASLLIRRTCPKKKQIVLMKMVML